MRKTLPVVVARFCWAWARKPPSTTVSPRSSRRSVRHRSGGGTGNILSRGHAAEALAWTKAVMTKLGLTLNEAKTSLRNARQERFDFLGYSFGPPPRSTLAFIRLQV
jgi:hypothetical protein